ncbi:hypothetical protein BN133_3344 [Cronobacter dublinensis 582]|nr:hypothetical protein BN133_3344 [Cronobacter dublinensis 582]
MKVKSQPGRPGWLFYVRYIRCEKLFYYFCDYHHKILIG